MIVAGALGAAAFALPAWAVGDFGPDAQLGWAALDLGSGRRMGLNEHRRVPMCSSFKWLLAAFVLWRVDHGQERLERVVAFGPGGLLAASPLTTAALAAAGGRRARMSVGALCAAITSVSDNAAANLLLHAVGGPAALTAWLRAHGDPVTDCARIEPFNNRVPLGDPRDTTTPAASSKDLRRFLFGDTLSPTSRARLMQWMLGCTVGERRLKAGLPAGWRIAHRTGTSIGNEGSGERNAAIDIGVVLPPTGAPMILAAYAGGWTCPLAEVEAWMASLARRVAAEWRGA